MAVDIKFNCDGLNLTENTPLDFGTVQAGTTSALKTVTVSNSGSSDAQQCLIEAKEATISNGFAVNSQSGTAKETYQAQKFTSDATNASWYDYAVLGLGKNFVTKLGGTLNNTNGSDTFVTKWSPPSDGSSGSKIWGNVFSCTYI